MLFVAALSFGMNRNLLLISFLFASCISHSQEDFFVLKKKHKPIQRFYTGYPIVFNVQGEWISGDITLIRNDSFYVREKALRYTMTGIDTVHFGIRGVALRDVTVMPRKTAMVYYRNDYPVLIRGHEKFAYIKNGLLFQAVGGGYVLLNTVNTLRNGDPVFSKKNTPKLGVGALVFLFGQVLRWTYRQHLNIGRKYHLEYIRISNETKRPY